VFRSLDPDEIRAGVRLDQAGLARYSRLGAIVTDDNQLLNYGPILRLGMNHTGFRTANVNIRLLKEIAQGRGPARLARDSLSYGE
jgi:hypothetical protein